MAEWIASLHPALASFEFREPMLLIMALLAAPVYLVARRLPAAVTYSSLHIADRAAKSLRVRLSQLPAILLALSVLAIATALSGPRSADQTTRVMREGIAIMLVVDRSGSMDARDFVAGDYSVSRLDAVKRALQTFVLGTGQSGGRPNDLIGVVAFGTYADGICPLTLDHGNLMAIVDQLEVARERSEAATALGEGLALAVERLRTHPAKSKVVVLLSDGVNNAGMVAPLQAAELAAALDIKVYTVGAGSTGIAPMPVTTANGRTVLRPTPLEIDEETLKRIANRTGGRYFNARDAEALTETYDEIDRLERTEITEIRYLQYREHYPWFVVSGLVLVLLSTLSAGTLLRRLP